MVLHFFQIMEGLTTCLSLNDSLPTPDSEVLRVRKSILVNQSDEDKKNLQTMIKVFVNSGDRNRLNEALEYSRWNRRTISSRRKRSALEISKRWNILLSAISDLGLVRIDSVILAYQNKDKDEPNHMNDLLFMWSVLEEFVDRGVIGDVGISDVETDTFISLYNAVKVSVFLRHLLE